MLFILIFLSFFSFIFSQESDPEFDDPFTKVEKPITEDDVPFPGDPMTNFWNDDAETQEEAMVRFYEFGRFVHIVAFGELMIPVGERANIYTAGMAMGGKFSYFLDWNLAITIYIAMGFIPISIEYEGGVILSGTSNTFDMGGGFKYYFNFYDISKLIASVNPYFVLAGGLYVVQDELDTSSISTGATAVSLPEYSNVGFKAYAGIGLEFPIFRKSILLGIEAGYHLLFLPTTADNTVANGTEFDYSGDAIGMSLSIIWDM